MLKLLFLLAAAAAAVITLVVLIQDRRKRLRRRVSRTRREGDYAERQSQWRRYLSLNQRRKTPRITDQRDRQDPDPRR